MSIYRIFFVAFFTGLFLLQGQDKTETKEKKEFYLPFELTIGANALDFFPVAGNENDRYGAQGDLFQDFTNFENNWNVGFSSVFLSLSTKINFFDVGYRSSYNNITKVNVNNVLQPSILYWSNDLFFKFRTSYIFKKQKFFKRVDPFIELGGGYTLYDIAGASSANGGVGLNIAIISYLGFTIQSNYKYNFETSGSKHFQHLAGIYVNTENLRDKDKDGVPDNKDACPNVPGLKKFNGCPDTDKDGIIDKSDLCPNLPGLAENNGCPDTDNDGVFDNVDLCIDIPGLVENNGCPIEEEEPKEEEVVVEAVQVYDSSLDQYTVLFAPANYKILGQRNLDILEQVKNRIVTNSLNVIVEGHASDDGSRQTNQRISEARAEAVKVKLIAMGVPENLITTKGFGEDYPIDKANNPLSRAKNRRVTFKVIVMESEETMDAENKEESENSTKN